MIRLTRKKVKDAAGTEQSGSNWGSGDEFGGSSLNKFALSIDENGDYGILYLKL
jgi:hypothetical protein